MKAGGGAFREVVTISEAIALSDSRCWDAFLLTLTTLTFIIILCSCCLCVTSELFTTVLSFLSFSALFPHFSVSVTKIRILAQALASSLAAASR